MDKLLLADKEYKILSTTTIQFVLPYNIQQKHVGLISQLPTAGIVYNGDCEGYRGTFDEDFQVLTLEKEGVDLGDSELSIVLLMHTDGEVSNPLLEKMSEQLECLNSLVEQQKQTNDWLKQILS